MLWMLARLGLRSRDVARLPHTDINWSSGTLQVMGNGRYQVRLALPQDSDHVFLRSIAPYKPFVSGDGVSSVMKHALDCFGIESPAKGAHLLRHTAAT
jgi:hypothetical protein